ncbi:MULTISPECIES: hypothetical protein [unclassified Virgibacillus]|uniref:hypothetical protein n=1 Tax=unclassified Virgibacillus TaxID=2620237 RepID=UPI0024DE2D2F|nr:hypothetical protein [Virgibacillus sp. LDC-1]
MPVCAHCGRTWSYGTTLKNAYHITKTCPFCGRENYDSSAITLASILYFTLPIGIIFIFQLLVDMTIKQFFGLLLFLIVVMLGIYPFIAKLSKERVPYW